MFLDVSPTILRVGGTDITSSLVKSRAHVHVYHATGEAKFWLEPSIELAQNYGLTTSRLNRALKILEEHSDAIRAAWQTHFGR